MSEAESPYERLRRAERELGEPEREVVEPVEETNEAAAAVADEVPLRSLAVGPRDETPHEEPDEEPDFASEHSSPTFANQMGGGPEGRPEPETPKGYAGMDS